MNTILGTPFLEQLKGILDLGDRALKLRLISKTLPLVMKKPALRVRGHVVPLPCNFSIFPSISFNIPPSVPILQHLSESSSVDFLHHPTPSDCLTVNDAREGEPSPGHWSLMVPPLMLDNYSVIVGSHLRHLVFGY